MRRTATQAGATTVGRLSSRRACFGAGLLASGTDSGTGPGLAVRMSGTLVVTGFSAPLLSDSSRNLSSIDWIEDLAASGPVSRMSLCWKPVFDDRDAGLLALLVVGTTPGSGLNCVSLERNDRILNLPSVRNGTRRLSSVTTFLISSGYCLAKYIEMSPPIEWPTIVTFS